MWPTYNTEPLKATRSLPRLEFGDFYIYLLDNPSLYTAARVKHNSSYTRQLQILHG